jgi:hypothetical protein
MTGIEIPARYDYNLVTGNYYFAPDCDVKIALNYLNFLNANLNLYLIR